jgi:hypothetical protein
MTTAPGAGTFREDVCDSPLMNEAAGYMASLREEHRRRYP